MQHLLLPQLPWFLLIYKIPMTTVVKSEQKISNTIRKWLRLYNYTTNICLYATTSPCPLPIKSLASFTKSSKLNGKLLPRESRDPFISSGSVSLNAGKWTATYAAAKEETRLDFKKNLGLLII